MGESDFPARWWHTLSDGRLQCDLCPRNCQLHEGQRGACFVRAHAGGRMVLTTYGRSSGFCLDPIEKKPLNHFFPGSSVLSFGTAGCNLACKFCQNWDISRARSMDRLMEPVGPSDIALAAQQCKAASVAYTYNDPVIFAEYAIDTAIACREAGIKNVAVTAAYIHPEPAHEFFPLMDAANVDLKAFTDSFYHRLCGGHLGPVLDMLAYIRHETNCWLEITTLLIPGCNDSPTEIGQLARWVATELGSDVPLHFSAFHPDWKMQEIPATPHDTLRRSRQIAQDAGLQHVYLGNVHDAEGGSTYCTQCHTPLIVRDWYDIRYYSVDPFGQCPNCHTPLSGRYAGQLGGDGKAFGPKRIPVRFSR